MVFCDEKANKNSPIKLCFSQFSMSYSTGFYGNRVFYKVEEFSDTLFKYVFLFNFFK